MTSLDDIEARLDDLENDVVDLKLICTTLSKAMLDLKKLGDFDQYSIEKYLSTEGRLQ